MLRRAAIKLARTVGVRRYDSEKDWLEDFASQNPCVFFIQIGAHDGKTDDKLYDLIRSRGWSGILVEPVPYLFERLVANHTGNPKIKFENSAIAPKDGEITFYRLRPNDHPMPQWYDQLGTMNREVILKHRHTIPSLDDFLIEEMIRGISFGTLLRKHNVQKIDLILIDTEGSDLDVLRQIDLVCYRPQLIIYEHKHLSGMDRHAAVTLLSSYGYRVFDCGDNSVAASSATWRQKLFSGPC